MKNYLPLILGVAYLTLSTATQAEDKKSEPESLTEKAAVFYNEKKYEEALQVLNQAIAEDPTKSFTYSLRAATYIALKRYSEARKDFNKLIEINPDDPFNDFNIGETYFLAKEYKEAIKPFQSFLKKEPNNQLVLFKIFLCHLQLGNKEKVDKRLRTLAPSPVSPFYYFAHAGANYHKEDTTQARDYLQRAAAIYPRNQIITFVDSFRSIGWLTSEEMSNSAIVTIDSIKNMSSKSFHAEPQEISTLGKLQKLMLSEEENQ